MEDVLNVYHRPHDVKRPQVCFDEATKQLVTVATVGYGDLNPITTGGRITVMFTFVTALAVFAGILGVLGANFFKVMKEEIDPNIDPLEEFQKERARHLLCQSGPALPMAGSST